MNIELLFNYNFSVSQNLKYPSARLYFPWVVKRVREILVNVRRYFTMFAINFRASPRLWIGETFAGEYCDFFNFHVAS